MRRITAFLTTMLMGVASLADTDMGVTQTARGEGSPSESSVQQGDMPGNASPWNQLGGPRGSGTAYKSRPPVKVSPDNLAWEVHVPPGLSSPVLTEKRIVLTAIEDNRLITLAFDKSTGASTWRAEAPKTTIEPVHKASSPAASTPFVDRGHIYVYFGSYGLLCYDHDGRRQWARPIPTPKTLYGMATSPIGYRDTLILVLDDDRNLPDSKLSRSKILAVKRASGATVWEVSRPFYRSGWSTPAIWSHDGGDELVVLGSGRAASYDPRTGVKKWSAPGFSRETIAMPISGAGHTYVSAAMLGGVSDEQPDLEPFWAAVMHFDSNNDKKLERGEMTGHFTFPIRPELPPGHPGYGIPLPEDPAQRKGRLDGMFGWIDKDKDGFWTEEEFLANLSFRRAKPTLMAIRPGGEGDISETHVTWRLHRGIPEIPSPVFFQDRIYLVCNGGLLTAVDATDGTILYRKRLGAPGQYSSSPVVANGHLYLASNRGTLSIVKAGDTFEMVHQHDLGEGVFATPAFDASTVYIRGETKLWAFRACAQEMSVQ